MSFAPSSLHLFPADDHQNNEDHLQQHLILNSSSSTSFPLLLSQPASSLSSSSSSCSVFVNPPVLLQDDRVKHDDYKGQLKQHQQLLKVNEYHISQHINESFDFPSDPSLPSILEIKDSAHEDDEYDDHELKPSIFDLGNGRNDSLKGTINERDGGLVLNDQMVPPKIRLLKKMNYMLSQVTPVPTRTRIDTQIRFQDHQQQQQPSSPSLMSHKNLSSSNSSTTNNYNPTTIRVCSDCNTTKTPLWRSGPRGPKSLCNACGIRQRKARRAMVAAAAVTASTVDLNTSSSSKTQLLKEKKLMNKSACYVAQYKKEGCKLSVTMTAGSSSRSKDPCHDNISTNLNKNSSDSHGVFPQDEKEAAILLMALSCGS